MFTGDCSYLEGICHVLIFQACLGSVITEPECALKAIKFWSAAADIAYDNSYLSDALRSFSLSRDCCQPR